jgi:glutamine synthetase
MFDGSSIAGWKAINESDMTLMPDPSSGVIDPFFAQTTLAIFCDIHEPAHRPTVRKVPAFDRQGGEKYLASTGVGDTAFFGPEAEFFIFDDVRFDTGMNKGFYFLDAVEGAYNTGTEYDSGNLGHRPPVKGGYFPRAAGRFRAGHPLGNARHLWVIWELRPKSITMKSLPRSMSWASSSIRSPSAATACRSTNM